MSRQSHQTSCYLVLEARPARWGQRDPETGEMPIGSVHVVRLSKSRPSKLTGNQSMVRVTFDVADNVFQPIMPDFILPIGEGDVVKGPITVDVAGVRR